MRVSIVSTAQAYPALDALAHLAGYLLRRGDFVRVFAPDAPAQLPQLLHRLIERANSLSDGPSGSPGFRSSDLFIYHYVSPHTWLNTLFTLDRGVVVLWYQPFLPVVVAAGPNAEVVPLPDELIRMASASDLVVVNDATTAQALQAAGAVVPERAHVIPPAVSLSGFSPKDPDASQRQQLDLLGKRILLAPDAKHGDRAYDAALALLRRVRAYLPETVLAVTSPAGTAAESLHPAPDSDSVRVLPPFEGRATEYHIADIVLSQPGDSGSRQRALEAMACGRPVLPLDPSLEGSQLAELVETAVQLLSDDAAYGEAVRRGLSTAARQSLEAFAEAWSTVLSAACGWLPVRMTPAPASAEVSPGTTPIAADRSTAADRTALDRTTLDHAIDDFLGIDLQQLRSGASVTLRDYEVRSPTPIFGPFIAWVRRNLTSHLREPYLDPTLERQEAFNLRAVSALEDLAARLAAYRQEIAQPPGEDIRTTPAGYAHIDPQIFKLLEQVEDVIDTVADQESRAAQAEIIHSALQQIRTLLAQAEEATSARQDRNDS